VRVFLSAGELSGDQHAAHLIRALRDLDPKTECRGFGGEQMREAGAALLHPLADEPIIGVTAVLPRLMFFRRLLDRAVTDMQSHRTDVLVLIDYPGFNLRLAEAARRVGIKTVYYIGPQIWAWAPGRIERIKRSVDLMLVVFDFERPIYERAGVPVRSVGHPLLDQLDFASGAAEIRARHAIPSDRLLLGLFPGSRPAEIRRIFPVMLEAARRVQSARGSLTLAAAVAPSLARRDLEAWVERAGMEVELIEGDTHGLMRAADLAFVASGTATLETGLLGTPLLVLYRTDALTYQIARLVVRLQHIGLVNVVAEREVAKEFIQGSCRPEQIASEAITRLGDPELKPKFAPVALELRQRLGQPGAAGRAAQAIREIAQL
jgi:lipid-A-disaccharide synthase